jgi:hypothetical protein
MVTIEQVELLEIKVSKAIEYVRRLAAENERLRGETARFSSENNLLYTKLDSYQTRISELEVLLQGFKQDQERIEQGIISALDRLNHFEDAVGGAESVPSGSGAGADARVDAGVQVGASVSAGAERDITPEPAGAADADIGAGAVMSPVSETGVETAATNAVNTDLGTDAGLSENTEEASDDFLDILKQGDAPECSGLEIETNAGGSAGDAWSLADNSEKPQQNPELDIF